MQDTLVVQYFRWFVLVRSIIPGLINQNKVHCLEILMDQFHLIVVMMCETSLGEQGANYNH